MTSEPNGAPSCGCPEFRASRRTFIKGLGAAFGSAVVTGVVGDVFTQTAFGATSGGNVLVVLSLRGGADGLSMVVPHGDPGYAAARPSIAIPTDRLVAADAMFGLHPQFAPLVPMWEAGRFGAVHAVGLPQPNRSHFSAMEVVEDADPSSAERRGWINRVVGLIGDGGPDQALQIGSSLAPTSLVGPAPAMAVSRLADIKLPGDNDPDFQAAQRRALSSMWTGVRGPMGRAVAATLSTTIELADLAADDGPPLNGASYPDGYLAQALRQTARLVRADLGTSVVTLDLGDWDHHTELGTLQWGLMRRNVADLAGSLAAFFTDLGALGDKVTVVTISEFGRRVEENGNYGVEHGYGNAMLLLGAGVRGGQVHAQWPGLSAASLIEGDLQVTRDYRSVLAEVIRSRFPAASVPAVFPGFTPEPVGAMH